jgi:hypothetical protein
MLTHARVQIPIVGRVAQGADGVVGFTLLAVSVLTSYDKSSGVVGSFQGRYLWRRGSVLADIGVEVPTISSVTSSARKMSINALETVSHYARYHCSESSIGSFEIRKYWRYRGVLAFINIQEKEICSVAFCAGQVCVWTFIAVSNAAIDH